MDSVSNHDRIPSGSYLKGTNDPIFEYRQAWAKITQLLKEAEYSAEQGQPKKARMMVSEARRIARELLYL